MNKELDLRKCIRDPIPEIAEAALYLNEAVDAHLIGNDILAASLIKKSDMSIIRDWTESIWGVRSPFITIRTLSDTTPVLKKLIGSKFVCLQFLKNKLFVIEMASTVGFVGSM